MDNILTAIGRSLDLKGWPNEPDNIGGVLFSPNTLKIDYTYTTVSLLDGTIRVIPDRRYPPSAKIMRELMINPADPELLTKIVQIIQQSNAHYK